MDMAAALDQFWTQRADEVRAFLERQPKYQKLSEEVAYVLERAIRNKGVEFASIGSRAKTLSSFCEKVVRKGYKKPSDEITDSAGVRVVYLYESDRKRIETLIEKEFTIVEKVDKAEKTDTERFGYGALHYLVKLGKKSSGARYDDLKDLVCEIQVRTILQDAWAIVAHHLSYKQESDVPVELRRKLNALSGLFETADGQFNVLKDERARYKRTVRELIRKEGAGALDGDINLDNLMAYLSGRLPDRGQQDVEGASELLVELTAHGYKKLKQLDEVFARAYDAAKAYEKKYPPSSNEGEPSVFLPVGFARACLDLTDDKYFQSRRWEEEWKQKIREFKHLVKK